MSILQRLDLRDFRNYEVLRLELEPGINVFVGANGQGKTNLLEAVYYLSILRSFRSQQLRHLCRWQQPGFIVRGAARGNRGNFDLAVQYEPKGRRLRLRGEPVRQASQFLGHLFCVAFIPEDIELVKGAGAGRRRLLDILLSQTEPSYLAALQDYARALKSRNALLRKPHLDAAAVRAFDEVIAARGASLMLSRRRLFQMLQPHLLGVCKLLFGEPEAVTMTYQPNVPGDADFDQLASTFRARLTEALPRDRDRGHTQVGPHRDDFDLALYGRALQYFGSEGQCRKAALLLNMAAAALLTESQSRDPPILLVDDVIGELDPPSRSAFCQMLESGAQVLFATTELAAINGLTPAAVYTVADGVVSRSA